MSVDIDFTSSDFLTGDMLAERPLLAVASCFTDGNLENDF